MPDDDGLEALLQERDRRYEQRFQDQDKAVAAALVAQEKAVAAALAAADRARSRKRTRNAGVPTRMSGGAP